MAEIIPRIAVHKTAVTDGDPIASFSVERAGTIRGTAKFSAAAKLQLDATVGEDTDVGYLPTNANLVQDEWVNFAFEARPGVTYTLRPSGANVTASLTASEVRGPGL